MKNEARKGLARRRYPRRFFHRRISILVGGSYFLGEGREIGEGGMLIEVSSSIKQGRYIVVNFIMPSTGFIVVKAEVRSIREAGDQFHIGLSFVNLPYNGRKGIREYIAAKTEEEAKEEMAYLKQNSN